MKNSTVKIMTGTALISLFVMAGCAEKDHMGMDEMKQDTMSSEMATESTMKKMDSNMDDMSHKNMDTDMKRMPEKMDAKMDEKMDAMKSEMDDSMTNDMKKMEQ